MANSYFKFKQFSITQENSAMKVGTDGVLLGAAVNCTKTFNILDIGTGTGLIAIMLAQRCNANIDAIEIDTEAYTEALLNVSNCKWTDRISIHHSSFQEFAKKTKPRYDLIISNPPFFSNSLNTPKESRTLARHNDSLTANDLFKGVKKLLSENGSFWIIIPTLSFEEYKNEASLFDFFCNNILWVKPTPEKAPKRVIAEFSKNNCKLIEKELIVESGGRHIYSEEYKALTKDFYLKF
ncbi:MAG: methyltransferase [Salinivirgaceae bacterium]|nr:methyltransferase [Salinivirgaceae bacterium]